MAKKKDHAVWVTDQSILRQKDLQLFESGILADAEIRCDGRTWKLHKNILCTRSVWFEKALAGSFGESEVGVVTVHETEQCDIDCFLKFIYTGSIDIQKSYPGDDAFVALMRIWKIADFYLQKDLRSLAVYAANDVAQEHARVFCSALPGADHDKKMNSIIKDSFNPAVSLLYDEEMGHLKPTFLPIYMAMAAAGVHELSKNEAFLTLLQDLPEFATEWATLLMKGFCKWESMRAFLKFNSCDECRSFMDDKGTLDTLAWVRNRKNFKILCEKCYRMPALTEWESIRR